MRSKDLSGWLKGGIILALLDIIFIVLAFLGSPFDAKVLGIAITQMPISYLYFFFFSIGNYFELILLAILGLLNWFIIGCILGALISLIIKRFKNKKGAKK